MNKFELKGKSIFLDGEHLKGVQSFKLKSKAENSYAELYLKLLVELPSDDNSNKEVEKWYQNLEYMIKVLNVWVM